MRKPATKFVSADIIKGYEVGKGDYIELDPEELEAVAIESKRTIDIDEFVPRDEIDELYLNDPYYIAPDGEVGQQAFSVGGAFTLQDAPGIFSKLSIIVCNIRGTQLGTRLSDRTRFGISERGRCRVRFRPPKKICCRPNLRSREAFCRRKAFLPQ